MGENEVEGGWRKRGRESFYRTSISGVMVCYQMTCHMPCRVEESSSSLCVSMSLSDSLSPSLSLSPDMSTQSSTVGEREAERMVVTERERGREREAEGDQVCVRFGNGAA